MPTQELLQFTPSFKGALVAMAGGGIAAIGTAILLDHTNASDNFADAAPGGSLASSAASRANGKLGNLNLDRPVVEAQEASLTLEASRSPAIVQLDADDGGTGLFQDSASCEAVSVSVEGVETVYDAELMTAAARAVLGDLYGVTTTRDVDSDDLPDLETMCCALSSQLGEACEAEVRPGQLENNSTDWLAGSAFEVVIPLASPIYYQGHLPGLAGTTARQTMADTAATPLDPCADPDDCIEPLGKDGDNPEIWNGMAHMPVTLTTVMSQVRQTYMPTALSADPVAAQQWVYVFPAEKAQKVDETNLARDFVGPTGDENHRLFGLITAALFEYGTPALVWVTQANAEPAPMLITGVDLVDDAGSQALRACLNDTIGCDSTFHLTFSRIRGVALRGTRPGSTSAWLKDTRGAGIIDPEMDSSGSAMSSEAIATLMSEATFTVEAAAMNSRALE